MRFFCDSKVSSSRYICEVNKENTICVHLWHFFLLLLLLHFSKILETFLKEGESDWFIRNGSV